MKVLVVFGTRPEAIKLAPLINELRQDDRFEVNICVTGQHRRLLDQALDFFKIKPDYDLDIMLPKQSLSQITARIIERVEPIINEANPDIVFVQGDTTTALAGALAAFYNKRKII